MTHIGFSRSLLNQVRRWKKVENRSKEGVMHETYIVWQNLDYVSSPKIPHTVSIETVAHDSIFRYG
jgi:hypothetical protein